MSENKISKAECAKDIAIIGGFFTVLTVGAYVGAYAGAYGAVVGMQLVCKAYDKVTKKNK